MRRRVLSGANLNDLKADILSMVREEIQDVFNYFGFHYYTEPIHSNEALKINLDGLLSQIITIFPLPTHLNAAELSKLQPKQLEDRLIEEAEALYEKREKEFGVENMRILERLVMLQIIDRLWVEHLATMENSRNQIATQGMLPGDVLPDLLAAIQYETAHTIFHVTIAKKEESTPVSQTTKVQENGKEQKLRLGKKIGPNDPCPCGSGKKYRFCCGREV
jgi:preprotein translocase subunit SecA